METLILVSYFSLFTFALCGLVMVGMANRTAQLARETAELRRILVNVRVARGNRRSK
jgi:hypothetical protein